MLIIKQITPIEIYQNRERFPDYVSEQLSTLITGRVWMTDLEQIVHRFQLHKITKMTQEDILTYHWNTERVDEIIRETFDEVNKHLPFDSVSFTVFPALFYPWFKQHDRSIWTNGFTNGPNSIQIAVPPNPDEVFLRYMVAHELHHATPINPIYNLTADNFSLSEWFKMEGGAELFALSLYEDKRWWKDEFTSEVEDMYKQSMKTHLDSVDAKIKNRFCFGDPKNGIPYLAGYAFSYNVFRNFSERNPKLTYREFLEVDSSRIIQEYIHLE